MQAWGEGFRGGGPDDPADAVDAPQHRQSKVTDHVRRIWTIARSTSAVDAADKHKRGAQAGGGHTAPKPHLAVGVSCDVIPLCRIEERQGRQPIAGALGIANQEIRSRSDP